MARPPKTPESPSETPSRPGKNGGTLRTGNPGNKGGTGRPPDAWKQHMQDLVNREAVQQNLQELLQMKVGPYSDPQKVRLYLDALKWAGEQAYPKQGLAVTATDDQGKTLTVRFEGEA